MTRESLPPLQEDESLIREFLLGKTPEVDRERLEERLLGDAAFSELVSAIEEELIDDYTAGLLFHDERHRFEHFFLVTEDRRRKVQFSAALARVKVRDGKSSPLGVRGEVLPVGGSRRVWMQVAAAAVAVLSLGLAVRMAGDRQNAFARLRAAEEQVAALQQSREVLIEEHERQLAEAEERGSILLRDASETSTSPPPKAILAERPIVVAMLVPGALRDPASSVTFLRVRPATLVVELRLELAEDSESAYAASVHEASGIEILRVTGLKSETSADKILVALQVPAAHLPPSDYSIRLWGNSEGELSELDRYYVRILPP